VQNDEAELHVDAWQSIHIFCRDALRRAKDQQRAWLQQRRRVVFFEVGDQVLLATKHLKIKTPSLKLTSRFIGPSPSRLWAPTTSRFTCPSTSRSTRRSTSPSCGRTTIGPRL
jgi:hypothetical protein